MSLCGANRRYTVGAVRNAQLAPVNFPGWVLRFYVERGDKPRYGAVPKSILDRLQQLGAELVDAPADRLAPMMWRFTVSIAVLISLCRLYCRHHSLVFKIPDGRKEFSVNIVTRSAFAAQSSTCVYIV